MRVLYLFVALCLSFLSVALEPPERGSFLGSKTVESLPDWFKISFLDFADDLEEAQQQDKHIMLYFHQNGCPYCAKLVAENFHNKALVAKLKQHFDSIQTNIWGDRALTDWRGTEMSEKQFASLMKVQFTPTLLFLDAKGNTLLRLNGYQSVEKMHKVLDFIADKKYRQQSFASYAQSLQKNTIGSLNKNTLFAAAPHLLERSKALPAQQYLAVFFEQPDCPSCDTFHKTLMSLKQTQQLLKPMQVVQLNALSDEKLITPDGVKTTAKKWYEALKLTDKPAVVFFAKNGVEIIRKDAFFKAYHFHGMLTYVGSGVYKTQANFQRYLEGKSEKLRAKGISVDIWK